MSGFAFSFTPEMLDLTELALEMRKRRKQGPGESLGRTTSHSRLMLLTLTNTCAFIRSFLLYHVLTWVAVLRMAYIEENLKIRSKPRDQSEEKDDQHADPHEALYRIADRWKVEKQKQTPDEGSVTNSLTMLTAIPEVDLGMEYVESCLR